jgi:hypothetical protein
MDNTALDITFTNKGYSQIVLYFHTKKSYRHRNIVIELIINYAKQPICPFWVKAF